MWGSALLARFWKGEAAALDEIYRDHADSIGSVVAAALRRYGGARGWNAVAADLPDLVQEVFARAFEHRTRRSFDGIRDYGPFLAGIARNVTVDHLRRRSRQLSLDLDRFFDPPTAPAPTDPASEYADRETLTQVERYLAGLPSELKQAHELLYGRGLSEREAAAALGVGRQVVRTRGASLREGLRRALEERERAPLGTPAIQLGPRAGSEPG